MKSSHVLGILSLVIFLSISVHAAFGHGVGFETLPPKMSGDRKVAKEVSSNVDNATNRRQITFSMFDANTGFTLRDVTYHVKTIKNNHVVFEGDYKTGNGALTFDLIPTDSDKITAEEKNNAKFFEILLGVQKNQLRHMEKISSLAACTNFQLTFFQQKDILQKQALPCILMPEYHFLSLRCIR
jgi:hypothetical protein